MAKKVPVIQIPRGTADDICIALGIGKTTLYDALNYRSHSKDAQNTRDVVLAKYGGVKTTKLVL